MCLLQKANTANAGEPLIITPTGVFPSGSFVRHRQTGEQYWLVFDRKGEQFVLRSTPDKFGRCEMRYADGSDLIMVKSGWDRS